MKVLHVISGGDRGGAKTHLLTLLGRLKRDIPVRVVCFMAGEFYREAVAAGLDCALYPQRTRFDLRVVPRLVGLVRDEGYPLIHSHGGRANFVTAVAKRWLGVPCVTTVHSDPRLDWEGQFYKQLVYTALNQRALRAMDHYFAVSESFRAMLLERGFPPDRLYTVYNGIEFEEPVAMGDWRSWLRRHGVPLEPRVRLVGTVGRLHPVKGHDVFIRAAQKVLVATAREAPVRFMVAGDGPELGRLEGLARKLGIDDRVHFLGHVAEVNTFLAGLDVHVLPSYSESFPYVILEAARLKKVTASTAVGGVPDLIRPGETGYLFDPGDTEGLARAVVDALADPARREALGEAVYQRARSEYSAEAMARRHLELYQIILARHGAGGSERS